MEGKELSRRNNLTVVLHMLTAQIFLVYGDLLYIFTILSVNTTLFYDLANAGFSCA